MSEKTTRTILIAEDDAEAVESWRRDMLEFNRATQPMRFVPIMVGSKRAAIEVLEQTRISCAVIDLRLPDEDGKPPEGGTVALGNDILERMLLEVGVPTVVYSGHTPDASKAVRGSPIKIIEKTGGGAMAALNWLAEHENLMSAMEATRKRIAQESTRLFTKSIWPRWEKTWKSSTNAKALADVITRQMAAHVAETLGLPEVGFHAEEFYHIPPLDEKRLGTGDLTEIGGQVYVVVTPRCNMALAKYPNHLLLSLCKPITGRWNEIGAKLKDADKKKNEKGAEELRDFAIQNHSTSSHFLPPCGDKGPWVADFKEIMTVPSGDVPNLLSKRFASISSSFVPNLVQRYAAYLGRIGQPDLDCDVLRERLCK